MSEDQSVWEQTRTPKREAFLAFAEQEGWGLGPLEEDDNGSWYQEIRRDGDRAWVGNRFVEHEDHGVAINYFTDLEHAHNLLKGLPVDWSSL